MTMYNLVCVVIAAAFFNVVLTAEDIAEDYQDQNNIERPVGRAYSLSFCDYSSQVGYSCLTCNRALHCYPGNVAILVDCYGLFRFCRDGRCSRFQGDKCFADTKLTTTGPVLNATIPTADLTAPVDTTANEVETTRMAVESVMQTVTEAVSLPLPIDPKETTKSDLSSTINDNVV